MSVTILKNSLQFKTLRSCFDKGEAWCTACGGICELTPRRSCLTSGSSRCRSRGTGGENGNCAKAEYPSRLCGLCIRWRTGLRHHAVKPVAGSPDPAPSVSRNNQKRAVPRGEPPFFLFDAPFYALSFCLRRLPERAAPRSPAGRAGGRSRRKGLPGSSCRNGRWRHRAR